MITVADNDNIKGLLVSCVGTTNRYPIATTFEL